MKRYLLLVFSMLTALVTYAYDYEYNGVYYNLDHVNETATVTYKSTSYNSYSGTINIPDYITTSKGMDYDVVSIGENAFRNSTSLTSITIATGIESIGANAFYGCSGLTTLKLPTSVESLGEGVFRGCSKLSSVTFSTKLTSLPGYAFYGCSALKSVTMPRNLATIGSYAFNGCTSLNSVSLSAVTSNIADHAFTGCSSLTGITLPSTTTHVGDYAFQNCSELANIKLNDGLVRLGDYALANCPALTEVTIPSSVTALGANLFYQDTTLASADLSACPVQALPVSCFQGCSALTILKLPTALTSIGSSAFSGCSKLPMLTIPAGVNSVASNAFNSCSNLKQLIFAEGMTTIPRTYNTYVTDVSLPSTTTAISNQAFYGCNALVSIDFPNSCTTIGNQAFYNCSSLSRVLIDASINTIGNNAFANCDNLTDLEYAEGTTTALRTYATKLTQVTIPSTCSAFADDIFDGCTALTRVNIKDLEMWNFIFRDRTSTPFACPRYMYLNGEMLTDLIADLGSPVSPYAFANVKGLKNVTLTGTVTGISTNAFVNSTDLVNVVMGNAVRTIGSSAFLGCNSLESVRMGSGLTTIDASAFYGCVSLTSVRMGGNEKSIGANAFKGCTALAAIELPATLTSLGNSAFEDCKVLTSINLPEGLTQISAGTFNGCLRLPEITIPDAVTTVGSNAFYGCAALTIVQVPDAVTSIGDNAFSQCSALNYVYVGRGIRTIGSTAFGNCPMIKGFYVLSTEVPTANTNAFNGSDPAAIKLYVPDESTAAYAAKSPWSSFAATIGLSEAPIYANSITLDPEVLIMSDDPYDETKIEFTLLPANATNNKVTWQSSNTSVATVSRTGLVTPEAEGVATITATASDKYGARATALVIIANDFVPMESISLDHSALTLTEGESLQLMPTTEPYDATYDVITWISSDERVATVDATGVVTAVRKGQATIIAQTSDGTKLRSQCALTVEEPTYASLTTIGDANGDGLVSNADLRAVVDLLLGQHGGVDVSFDVNRDGHIGIADITTIIDALQKEGALPSGPVKYMKLNAEQYDVVVGEARTITTTLVPFRSGSHIDWTVSDPAFISLDATYGSSVTFTALLPGKVTITASTNDGTDISASITVNITPNNQGTADGHAWVDLGLPSGTRWATMNIGASTPEAYGDYIAWGEKTAKQTYDWTTYALCNGSATTLTKYCTATANGKRDDKTSLESADDAAAQRWSSNWSTPSREQLAELFNDAYTTTVWTTQGGIYGRKVTSKANGSSIFLPAAGYVSEFGPSSRGTGGYYASRTLANPSTKAYGVNFGESTITTDDASFRSVGQSVRPVLSPALRLDFTSMQLIKGERYDLARTLSTTDGPPASMLWSSSNPAVATVSEAGEVHAVGAGTAAIYATLNDGSGVTATITLNVNEALVISGGSNLLRLGKTMQLSVNTACPVTWSSSDLGVATASNSGLVTAINVGKTTITAIASNGISAQYNISVRETVCFTVNGVTFNMQLVEHGTFQMGSEDGFDLEKPVHNVTISKDYYIGETEVTQGLWYAVMGQKPTSRGNKWSSSYGLGDDYPAYYISWSDCQEFITKLNQFTGQTFRMPTEAEWEYAAKGGNMSRGYMYSGSNTIDEVAWYTSNSSSQTHPVATKQPNELGIYDMSGNVWEWCSDWCGSYSSAAVTDPVGATSGSTRVGRGGSWYDNATNGRTAYRDYYFPGIRFNDFGFRLALSPSK